MSNPWTALAGGRHRAKALRPLPDRVLRLARRIAAAQRAFARRLAEERRAGGFFQRVSEAAPRYRSLLDNLRADDDHLFARLTGLRLDLERARPREVEAIETEVDEILAAIGDQMALKLEILRDALETPA